MSRIDLKSLLCPACGAPYTAGQSACGFCGSALPTGSTSDDLTGLSASDGSEDIIDYYSMLGLTAADRPGPLLVNEAVLATQERHLLNRYIQPDRRQELTQEIEVAGWILTNDRARREYDSLLQSLANGMFNDGHLGELAALQRRARIELGFEQDQTAPEELLQQGIGYQGLGMHREAIEVLRRAVAALPDSGEAHYRYAQSLLQSDNPLALGGHHLRQAASSFKTAATLDPTLANASAAEALCQGLLARDAGEYQQAQTELRRAVQIDPKLSHAWRALAALALRARDYTAVIGYCRRTLLCDAQDEQAYLFLTAACWHSGQRDHARDAAARAAALRGAGWTAERVLREIIP